MRSERVRPGNHGHVEELLLGDQLTPGVLLLAESGELRLAEPVRIWGLCEQVRERDKTNNNFHSH